jgi:D-xylose reductase
MTSTIEVAGSAMPAVGLGLWKIDKGATADVVCDAIEMGYRHLDSAADYGNEIEVGQGIEKALSQGLCSREDLWLTSKLWNTYHRAEHVEAACRKTLQDLGVDYLDLYLIHFPISLQYVDFETRYPPEWLFDLSAADPVMQIDPVPLSETWKAMEALQASGLVKNIGICNYNSALLHDLMSYAEIKPAMLQVESHPYLTQQSLIRAAANYDMAVTAFSPLGALSYVPLDMASSSETVLEQDVVIAASQRLNRSPAQIVLRWGVQRNTAVIPKSVNLGRLKQNLALFDFELSTQEMDAISGLNQNRRFNDPGVFCDSAFNTFHPIYD